MKKLLLFAFGAMMSMTSFAQVEEDVTYYIQNAGFDEDLTFQMDGKMKDAVTTNTSLSDRSWAYIAEDSTVYARPKDTSSQSRPDGRKMDAVNGFKGRIQGWTLGSNAEFPKCEWTYFGSVPYDLPATAVPIADDGSTYLAVPERPTEFDGGVGFVYLRAGWTNSATYKQVVKLPCAQYRLEYWTININPNTSAVASDLTQIVCRKDVFKEDSNDENSGLQAKQWTKHSFEFTPTAEFTMQFGYEAANAGSGGQPIVALDGIKLYKIGEADPEEILTADLNDAVNECQKLAGQAAIAGYSALAEYISDYQWTIEDYFGGNASELEAALKEVNARVEEFRQALEELSNVDAIIDKMENLLTTTNFAGKAEFQAAYSRIEGYRSNPWDGKDIVAQILGAVAEAEAAIKAYYMSQEASVETPADYTIFVKHPWFITETAEPTFDGTTWVFPNADSYTEGSGNGTNTDLTSEGWTITGASGGDQRLNWQRGRSCWNAWNSNFTSTLAVGQEITDLPNGYYTVSADMITQAGYANGTQKVYAESSTERKTSTAYLTSDDYDNNVWETVSMSAADKVLVVDGKLTIGAQGTGDGNASAGWFLVTNFKLYYLGAASDEDIAAAVSGSYNDKLKEANDLAAKMHFALDRQSLNDSIAAYGSATTKDEYLAAIKALTAAVAEAQASEAKYEEYMEEGKTLPVVQATLNGEGYQAATEIVQFAYDQTMAWINGPEGTYTKLDDQVNLLKNYLNTYAPVYNEAADLAAKAAEGKEYLEQVMSNQKALLVSEMKDAATVNKLIDALREAMVAVQKQIIWTTPGNSDYTAYIINPYVESENGWEFVRGNGDKNTTSGQWYDDGSTRYIDSYNSAGLVGFKAMQVVTGLPNGTYDLGVYTRTPAEGAYVFYAVDADTTYVEIPLDYYIDEESVEQVASDTHGPIWEEAATLFNNGSEDETVAAIYNANSGKGRGWKHQDIEAIVVTNHTLCIGVLAGSIENHQTEKDFAGNWFSASGWSLTLTALGDNTGWAGPLTEGIENIVVEAKAADGIYTLSGVKSNKLQRGMNIIISNGKAYKVLVK